MAVPAHDERDWDFAKKHELGIRQSIADYVVYDGISYPQIDKETLRRKTIDVILENQK